MNANLRTTARLLVGAGLILLMFPSLVVATPLTPAEKASLESRALKTIVTEMDRARDTGDGSHYDVAQTALDGLRRADPGNYEAIRMQAWILTGRHRFAAALGVIRHAVAKRPYDSWNYGVMVDALVELGRYREAVQAAQKMVDLRPSVGAYSRISYLRWLHGDPEGADEMMRLAIDTAPAGSIEAAWTNTQLGNLQFDRGMLGAAEQVYRGVLSTSPHYVHALAGVARVQAARGRFSEAIATYRESLAQQEIIANRIALGDVYAASGDSVAATAEYRRVERDFAAHAENPETRLQQGMFWADHGMRPKQALRLAEQDIADADDIQAWDAAAWARYRNGRYREAWQAERRALRLGTKDAKLLYHAGMIRLRLGDTAEAQRYLGQALETNRYFSLLGAKEARVALTSARESPSPRVRLELLALLAALPLAVGLGYVAARRRLRA